MSYSLLPSEISLGGVYFSPLIFAALLGLGMALLATRLLERFDLARYIWYPSLFFLALAVTCTCLTGFFIIPFVVPAG